MFFCTKIKNVEKVNRCTLFHVQSTKCTRNYYVEKCVKQIIMTQICKTHTIFYENDNI